MHMKSRTFRVLYTSDIHGRLFAAPGNRDWMKWDRTSPETAIR